MPDQTALDDVRSCARETLRRLNGLGQQEDMDLAKQLVGKLRDVREYDLMGSLAEAVSRRDPKDARNRRLYAQYLIDTGKPTAAVDVLAPLARRLPKDHPEHPEAFGLLGRSYKQIFFDAADKSADYARDALKNAVACYRRPFEENPRCNTWHGVNLVALLTRMRRLGIRAAADLQPGDIARRVVDALEAQPKKTRDDWFQPTLAEASLGLDDWESTERHIRQCVTAESTREFHVASLLRQFTEVWDLEATDERGKAVVATLRARLLELSGGRLDVSPTELQRLRAEPRPDEQHLEALLGDYGPVTFTWWKTGLDRAASVALIRDRMKNPIGTGFLVRAGDIGLSPADESLLLTNYHVVNEYGASPGIKPDNAEVVFESSAGDRCLDVECIVWCSPIVRHDASLLRLKGRADGAPPLPLASELPKLEANACVYVIGHPGGRTLSFSFQNNELLAHEGPTQGRPQIPGVCRVHYRAPTEPGSSGSPVFNDRRWEVIALHHAGRKADMARLNGEAGTYAANEGISIQSIRQAIKDLPRN